MEYQSPALGFLGLEGTNIRSCDQAGGTISLVPQGSAAEEKELGNAVWRVTTPPECLNESYLFGVVCHFYR